MTDETPAPKPERRRKGLAARAILAWTASVAVALVVLATLALILADTSIGHRTITRLVAGFAPANGLQVRVGRIEGSIYGRMTLRDLELRDPQGVFLTSPALTLDWRPTGLIRNHFVAREISSGMIRVLRRPALRATPRPPDQPLLPDIDITIDRLDIRQIVFEPPVAGRRHIGAVAGNVDIVGGRARVNLDALTRPQDGRGGGDRLLVRLDAVPDANRLGVDVRLSAPAGGVVASLSGLRQPMEARIGGAGDWARWNGRATASLGAQSLLDLGLAAQNGRFSAAGLTRPALLVSGQPAQLLQPALRLDFTGTLRDRRLDTDLRARSNAVDVAAQGVLDLGANRFRDFRIVAQLLQPGALLDQVRGRDVRLAVDLDGAFATPRVDYRLSAATLGFGETLVQQLVAEGRFTVRRDRTVAPIRASIARVTGVDEAVGGVLRNLRLDGDLVITPEQIGSDNLRLRSAQLNATLVMAASLTTGEYDAALKGTINRYQVAGVGLFNLTTDARLVPAPNGQFVIRGNVRVQSVRLDNASVSDFLGGRVLATAVFQRSPDGAISVANLNITAPRLRVVGGRGRLAPNGAIQFAATGQSEQYGVVNVAVQGSMARPVVRLRAPDPNLPAPLTDVDVTLRGVDGGYTVVATAASPYGPVEAEVGLRLGAPLTIEVRRGLVAGISVTGRVQQTAAGPFAGQLNLQGQGLTGTATLAAAASVQQIDLDLQAANARIPLEQPVTIARGDVQARALLYPGAPVVTGTLSVNGLRQGDFELAEANGKVDYRNDAGRVQLTASGQSGVPFTLAADATLTPSVVRVDAKGTVNRTPVRLAAPAEIRKVGDGWRLLPATVVTPQGRMQVTAATAPVMTVAARLESLDLALIRAFAPSYGVGGTASGTVNLTLPPGALPNGRAQLTIRGLTRTGVATVPVPVDVAFVGTISEAGAEANAVIRRRTVPVGRLQARLAPIPAGPSVMERLLAAPLSGGVRYNGPARVLWALTGIEGQEVSGPVALGADFTGRLGQPQITGVVRGRGLRYENHGFGTVIDNMVVDGRLTGSRLDLASVTGRAGSGTLAGSGFINLAADEGFPMDLRLRLTDAQLARSDDLNAVVTGDIAITNSRAEPALISGRVVVEEARYRIGRPGAAEVVELTGVRRRGAPPPQGQSQAPAQTGLPSTWRLNIQVEGDNRIFVSGMGLESEWRANLRVTGSVNQPSITGEVRATRGEFSFAGRRLDLSHGIIRFAGESPPNPQLDIEAETTVEGVSATINITGTAEQPDIAFASVPALPQDEVLSRLLFGSSVTELTTTQALQLAASLNALRGGSGGLNPVEALRGVTGVDRLRITGGEGDAGFGLGAGKYITNNIYVEVTTDARGFTAIQLEIALTRALSLLSQVGSFGGTNINLRYSQEY